jgi:restriction system protein
MMSAGGRGMEARRIWAIRAGTTGQADRIFLEQQQIGLSSADVDDDMSEKPASRDAFKEAFAALVLRVRPESIPSLAGQLFRFVHDVKIGDSVIYPRKSDRTLHWGEITGPYVFSSLEGETFAHRRSVQWKAKLRRDQFSPGALYELGATLSLFEVKSFAEEILGKFDPPAANEPEGAPAQCESEIARGAAMATRDFIVKKLNSELKGYLLEPFVADLFRAMGYRTHTTRKTRDNGIDVIAHRDELGIEPPILKIPALGSKPTLWNMVGFH